MKKWMALLLTVAVTLSLCACASSTSSGKLPGRESDEKNREESRVEGQPPVDQSSSASESTTSTQTQPETREGIPAQQFSIDGGSSIDVLREQIAQSGAMFGVGYVGYFEYHEELGIDFAQWYEAAASPFAASYPFFSEIDSSHTIGESGYLYCILGSAHEDSIAVTNPAGQTLYFASNGDPILLFCDAGGNGQTADLTVTITAADGTACTYVPMLDQQEFPQLLLSDNRQNLSWLIQPQEQEESTLSLEALLAEGWLGINEYGLAGDDVLNPQSWHVYIWDEEKQTTVDFSLAFCPNPPVSAAVDGEVLMQCFYENEETAQAEWQGWWKIETEPDQASLLQLDLMLMDGEDKAHYEAAATLSETYWALIHPNGESLLLIPESGYSALPFMGEGVPGVELTLAMG